MSFSNVRYVHSKLKFGTVRAFACVVWRKWHFDLHNPLVKLKLNTMLKSSTHFVELFPDDFRPEKVLDPSTRNLARYRLISQCEALGTDSAMIWGELEKLDSTTDQTQGLQAVFHLSKLAQNGKPLQTMCDEKTLHKAFDFRSPTSQRTETVWRYRKGNVRVLFYLASGKIVLLACAVAKREGKYSKATKALAQSRIEAFLQAEASSSIDWVSRESKNE